VASVTCLGWLLLARTVYAGGWATFTLDHVPDAPRAGEPIDLSFVARGHGQTPFDLPSGEASFVFTNRATGEILTASASPSGRATGHHTASIVLPTAGTWNWELQPAMYPPVQFLPLTVLPAVSAGTSSPSLGPSSVADAGSLLLAIAAADLTLRDQPRRHIWVTALTGALLFAPAGGLWSDGAISPVRAQPAADHAPSTVARGEALFVAKGCITCHHYDKLQSSTIIGIGPDLSAYKASSEFLHMWLANPPAVKPNTQMPNLGLQAAEIDELVAFLAQE
jgi:cytochrome c2